MPLSGLGATRRHRHQSATAGLRALRAGSCVSLIPLIASLAACGNPYALKTTGIEYKRPTTAGSIAFTDPKLYRREALIQERRDEVTYYDLKISKIDDVKFTPEVIRELQSITTLSASLGIKFDPASGLKYRRDTEVSDAQQEIAMVRLQLQLDQLKRDAELARAKFAAQDTPVNSDVSKAPDGTVTNPQSSVSPDSLNTLVESVNALKAQLQTALSAGATGLSPVTAAASPFDTFNDTISYRALVNAARNSASLDELHDRDGAALIRLNLTATVLPPAKEYSATFGRLQMKVRRPQFGPDDPDVQRLYRDWLWRISSQLSVAEFDDRKKLTGFHVNAPVEQLGVAGSLFEVATFDYSTGAGICDGVQFGVSGPPAKGCVRLRIAVPALRIETEQQSVSSESYDQLYAKFSGSAMSYKYAELFKAAKASLPPATQASVEERCQLPETFKKRTVTIWNKKTRMEDDTRLSILSLIYDAIDLRAVIRAQMQVDNEARLIISSHRGDVDAIRTRPANADLLAASRSAAELLDRVFEGIGLDCAARLESTVITRVPDRFIRTLQGVDRVAVYDMGPKARVQVLSSMARAAEAISLAASISGQIPGNGIGADGNVAYGRSAIGKADALERVPLVVAYATPADGSDKPAIASTQSPSGEDRERGMPVFGWLMGPRTTLDAKKKALRLEQVLTPYDLSVDLSVPGAWPYVELATETVWAPDWQRRNLRGGSAPDARVVRVPLAPTTQDLDNLTARLFDAGTLRVASIERIEPATISACARSASLQVIGDNIWRASKVVIGGQLLAGDAVSILPDMRGLLVTLDKAEFPATEAGSPGRRAAVAALTPYGPAPAVLTVTDAKADGTCAIVPPAAHRPGDGGKKKPPKKPAKPPKKPGKKPPAKPAAKTPAGKTAAHATPRAPA